MNLFEKATKNKWRFETIKGDLTAEQVWDLPLQSSNSASLDNLAKHLNRTIKSTEEESFVSVPTVTNRILVDKLDIVKHVIAVRMAENEARRNASAKAERKQKILAALSKKKDSELDNLSVEELEALAKEA